jgi:adenylyltransferase/sulfurtransferase
MQIPPQLLRQCFEQGAACYPEEACGLLSGPEADPDTLTAFHPVENQLNRLHAEDPERYPRTAREGYHLDPLAFLKLERALRAEGRRIKVIFHSHPDVGAYFSEEDRQRAMWGDRPLYPGMVYLVCGIKNGRPDGAVLVTFNEATGAFDQERVAAPGTAGDAEVA